MKYETAIGHHRADAGMMVFAFSFRNHSRDYRNMLAASDRGTGNENIRSLISATLRRKGSNEKVPRANFKSSADKKPLVNDSIIDDQEYQICPCRCVQRQGFAYISVYVKVVLLNRPEVCDVMPPHNRPAHQKV